jgi:hypothetical protein
MLPKSRRSASFGSVQCNPIPHRSSWPLLRPSPDPSYQNKTRERSEKRPCKSCAVPTRPGMLEEVLEVMEPLLFRANMATGCNWSITQILRRCSRGQCVRCVAGKARCASWFAASKFVLAKNSELVVMSMQTAAIRLGALRSHLLGLGLGLGLRG